jgi:hypothetical protein
MKSENSDEVKREKVTVAIISSLVTAFAGLLIVMGYTSAIASTNPRTEERFMAKAKADEKLRRADLGTILQGVSFSNTLDNRLTYGPFKCPPGEQPLTAVGMSARLRAYGAHQAPTNRLPFITLSNVGDEVQMDFQAFRLRISRSDPRFLAKFHANLKQAAVTYLDQVDHGL